MVKYKLVRPRLEESEEYERAEEYNDQIIEDEYLDEEGYDEETFEDSPRKKRKSHSLYSDIRDSYRNKKNSIQSYYQHAIEKQKNYYDNDENWQMKEQYQRNNEFGKKILIASLVFLLIFALFLGLKWLFK